MEIRVLFKLGVWAAAATATASSPAQPGAAAKASPHRHEHEQLRHAPRRGLPRGLRELTARHVHHAAGEHDELTAGGRVPPPQGAGAAAAATAGRGVRLRGGGRWNLRVS